MEILERIPVTLEAQEVRKGLHMEGDEHHERVRGLMAEAHSLITARAVYRVSYIEARSEDGVTIGGICFKSGVLRKNLEGAERVFPYVVTIGDSLEKRADACKELLDQYCLDIIGNMALTRARETLEEQLRSRYALDGLSAMSPGSLRDWAIEEQRPLFSLLGDGPSAIGVALNDHLLMIPRKSLSGICFPTEVPFFSCQLCPRKNCPGRKAEYDGKLAREYGLKKQGQGRPHPSRERGREPVER